MKTYTSISFACFWMVLSLSILLASICQSLFDCQESGGESAVARFLGWERSRNWDNWDTMLIYTIATVCFFLDKFGWSFDVCRCFTTFFSLQWFHLLYQSSMQGMLTVACPEILPSNEHVADSNRIVFPHSTCIQAKNRITSFVFS